MLPAGSRLRRRADFTAAVRASRGVRGKQLLVVHASPPAPGRPSRIGFVVPRSVGPAVQRNQVKRRLRHLMAARLSVLPAGTDLVVRALPPSATAGSAELGHALDLALERSLHARSTSHGRPPLTADH